MDFRESIECKGCGVAFTPKKCRGKPMQYCTAECHKAASSMISHYGINMSEYNAMKAMQGEACAICGDREAKLYVDHCHDTGKIRGLLCQHCNTGLGAFKDDTEAMQQAIGYVTHAEYAPEDGQPRVGKRTFGGGLSCVQ